MDFIKKHWIKIAVALVVIVVGFYWYKNRNSAAGTAALGKMKSGAPYYEADIAKEIGSIKASPEWYKKIEDNAIKEGMPLAEALRKNAIYMLETAN